MVNVIKGSHNGWRGREARIRLFPSGWITGCLKDRTRKYYLLMSFAGAMYAFIAATGAEITANRYIYPVYPIFAIWAVSLLDWMTGCLTKNGRIRMTIEGLIVAFLCAMSLHRYGVDYQYSDYDAAAAKADTVAGYDCILYDDGSWLDTYTALPLKFVYDETRFVRKEEVSELEDILHERRTDDGLVVCLPDQYSQEETQDVLDRILSATHFKGYHLVYQYYTQAYILSQ